MGAFNTALVPAAILYDNPGITKEEFAKLLNKIIYNADSSLSVNDLEEKINPGFESKTFHRGLFELSELLGLRSKKEFELCYNPNYKEYLKDMYLDFESPLIIQARRGKNKWLSPLYIIQTSVDEIVLDEFKNQQSFFHFKPRKNNYFKNFYDDEQKDKTKKKISKIHSIKKEIIKGYKRYDVNYDYQVVGYNPNIEVYESLKGLIKKHPKYNPDTCIDWNKEEGVFLVRLSGLINRNVIWQRIDDRYFLKNPMDLSEYEYTSLIITAEAIRKKAWGLFQFHGYDLTQKFLVENEDSQRRHTQAIIDYGLYQIAKKRNMRNSEYLKYRLMHNASGLKKERLSDRMALHIVYTEANDPYNHGLLTYSEPPKSVQELIEYEKKRYQKKINQSNPFSSTKEECFDLDFNDLPF
jgi:hypothetical protein